MKLIGLIKKAYNKLLRKKSRGEVWGQKFDGYVKQSSGVLVGRIELRTRNVSTWQ